MATYKYREVRSEGGLWVFFDIETAMDTAQAALRIQGTEARLPLGARRGEFDLVLDMETKSKANPISMMKSPKQPPYEKKILKNEETFLVFTTTYFGRIEAKPHRTNRRSYRLGFRTNRRF